MSRMSLYTANGQLHGHRFGQNRQQLQLSAIAAAAAAAHESGSLIGSSASSSLAMDLNGYDQAIQDLTESLNEVKITAALALQESQLVREQMQQGILSVLSELTTMWCQDFCTPPPPPDFAISPTETESTAATTLGQTGQVAAAVTPSDVCGGGGGSGGGGSSGCEDQRTNFRYKTQLCKNFMSGGGMGRCAKGEACQYAHGRQELRRICEHPRYKTKMCSLQITLGFCPHGTSCFFAHHSAEMRNKEF